MNELELKLGGVCGEIDAHAVSKALDSLVKMVQSVTTQEQPQPVLLSNLAIGSAILAMKTEPEETAILTDGLKTLQTKSVLPDGWNLTTVAALKELYDITRRDGVAEVSLSTNNFLIEINPEIAENASKVSGSLVTSLGSVRGKLYRYSSQKGYEASLKDDMTGSAIKLEFTAEIAAQVRTMLDEHVVVWGRLSRLIYDQKPTRIEVTGIKQAKKKHSTPRPIHEGLGILGSDWTNGMGSVEWVQSVRHG